MTLSVPRTVEAEGLNALTAVEVVMDGGVPTWFGTYSDNSWSPEEKGAMPCMVGHGWLWLHWRLSVLCQSH